MMSCLRRVLACTAFLLCVTVPAAAQATWPGAWAVQTVALRDYREAQAAAAELKTRQFDSYTEFAMQDGLQFVRVRVGCFTTREGADAMAEALAGRVTPAAGVAEFTQTSNVAGCVNTTVGFMKPQSWEPVMSEAGLPTFNVTVAGLPAHITHDGERWWLDQGHAEHHPLATTATAEFTEVIQAGVRFVALVGQWHDTVLCPGKLLASIGQVAIVEQGELLVACKLETSGPGATAPARNVTVGRG